MFLYIGLLVILTGLYLALWYNMRYYHFFEYRQHKFQIHGIYLSFMIYLVISIYEASFSRSRYINRNKNLICNDYICDLPKLANSDFLDRMLNIFHNQLEMTTILVAFILVKVKKSDDILSGVSKLDKLLKISNFQKYKNPGNSSFIVESEHIEEHSGTIVTTTSEVLNERYTALFSE
jgi:hypothetical protein